jgi:uncharacterized protein YlxP (DUF503 family)
MPKKTLSIIAKEQGLTLDQVKSAKTNGVNVWNPSELGEWAESRRHRIKPGATISDADAGGAQSLEEIEDALRKAQDIDTVKILKEKLLGLKAVVQVRQETKELVSVGEVDARDIRVAAVVKAGVLKLCNDSAPMCEGLGAAAIHAVLLRQGTQVLEMMADEQSAFWRDLK